MPELEILEVVHGATPRDLPRRHLVGDERRRLVPARERARVSARVEQERDLRHREADPGGDDPLPPLAARARRRAKPARSGARSLPPAYTYVIAPSASDTGNSRDGTPAIRAGSHARPPSSARQRKSGSIATSKATRPSSKSHGDVPASTTVATPDGRAARPPIRKPAEEQDGAEDARSRRSRARPLDPAPVTAKYAGEAVDEERALVVEERREVEREARAVLVAPLRRDRVRVVRDRRLVTEEPGRDCDGETQSWKAADREHDAEPRAGTVQRESRRSSETASRADGTHEPVLLPARDLLALVVAVLEAEEDERARRRDAAVGQDHDAIRRDIGRAPPASGPAPGRRGRRSRGRSARRSERLLEERLDARLEQHESSRATAPVDVEELHVLRRRR